MIHTTSSHKTVFSIIALVFAIGLSGCSLVPTVFPTNQPKVITAYPATEQATEIEEPAVTTHALEEDGEITVVEDPWELMERANTVPGEEARELLLRAAKEFVNRGQLYTATTAIEKLETYSLTPDQRFSLTIIRAQITNASGEPETAISTIDSLNISGISDPELKKQMLEIKANSQINLGHQSDAVATLLEMNLLLEKQDQLGNHQTILSLLQSMSGIHLSLLREISTNPSLNGWIALADTLNATTSTLRQLDIENWKSLYPDHPVHPQLLKQYTNTEQLQKYNQVALLLPLTSNYGSAARAFYEGFMQAHGENNNFQSPQITLYDIGDDPLLTSFYYQAAVNEGADFVVGPLGRKAADELLSSRKPEISTLLIAEIPAGMSANNLFGISLSPEKEARQVAKKTYTDGLRSVSVFRSESEWGSRVAQAFISEWEDLGGIVVKNSSFPKDVSDYTRVIQRFLGLDKSIGRQRLLEAQTGTNLKFIPRRNEDMDFLFLAANAEQSRLVVPQLRFFQAHNLLMYATSYIYAGNPNPAVDADLDGLIFGEMKWMLDGVKHYKEKIAAEQAKKAVENTNSETTVTLDGTDESESDSEESVVDQGEMIEVETEVATTLKNPYRNTNLDRLFALGLQSYRIIPRLDSLRKNPWGKYYGEVMAVSVEKNGSISRHPVWTMFSKGLAEPLNHINVATTNTPSE